ncbi:uncharacterized protein JCM6883_001632 [Sporobolomyces salmoneus]|uniref:uncharacterized protein n=1 Tax=Sporobolomyces salmoneus TaxID=183962 RepID=UPI0031702883
MSYTAIPTSQSQPRSSTSSSESSRRGSQPSSQLSLLPTSSSRSSDDYRYRQLDETKDETYGKGCTEGHDTRRNKKTSKVIKLLLLTLVVITLIGFAYVVNENDRVEVTSWIQDRLKSEVKVDSLLVRKVETANGTHFSYYPQPLTNPLSPQWELDFDDKLTIESLPQNVSTSAPSSLVFHCAHSNLTYCAQAYRVLFVGPTMHSPTWSESTQLDERRVQVSFQLRDPGEYQVYAWPEHDECNPFQPELHDWKIRPYFKLAVTGTPATITVDGPPPVDSARECSLEDDLTDGRWISRKHLNPAHLEEDSPLYEWVQSHLDPPSTSINTITDYRKYNYIFANYDCKLRHRTFEGYVNEIKPSHLLFLGDSITRDQYCMQYATADQSFGACLFGKWDNPYGHLDKNVPLLRTSDNETTMMSFHWEPLGDPVDTEKYLTALAEPPSHIFFEVGLWLTEKDTSPEAFVNGTRQFVEALTRLAPEAKLMTRTVTSAVQPIACYDKRHIQRRIFEPVNEALLKFMAQEFPQVAILDSYKIYNNRPESSEDGRHYERVEADPKWSKPEEGAVTYAMTDIIFETWRLQGLKEKEEGNR